MSNKMNNLHSAEYIPGVPVTALTIQQKLKNPHDPLCKEYTAALEQLAFIKKYKERQFYLQMLQADLNRKIEDADVLRLQYYQQLKTQQQQFEQAATQNSSRPNGETVSDPVFLITFHLDLLVQLEKDLEEENKNHKFILNRAEVFQVRLANQILQNINAGKVELNGQTIEFKLDQNQAAEACGHIAQQKLPSIAVAHNPYLHEAFEREVKLEMRRAAPGANEAKLSSEEFEFAARKKVRDGEFNFVDRAVVFRVLPLVKVIMYSGVMDKYQDKLSKKNRAKFAEEIAIQLLGDVDKLKDDLTKQDDDLIKSEIKKDSLSLKCHRGKKALKKAIDNLDENISEFSKDPAIEAYLQEYRVEIEAKRSPGLSHGG